jgi:hypothetical protein
VVIFIIFQGLDAEVLGSDTKARMGHLDKITRLGATANTRPPLIEPLSRFGIGDRAGSGARIKIKITIKSKRRKNMSKSKNGGR